MIFKRTKIVCTIGPASENLKILEKMVKAGMNAARLNFSHGTYENHHELIKKIRQTAEKLDQPISIIGDLQGPRIRIGKLPDQGVKLKAKEKIVLTTDFGHALGNKIPVNYVDLHKDLKIGDKILLVDGLIELKVVDIKNEDFTCHVISGGILYSGKGMNFPDTVLSIPPITLKDELDVKFAVEEEIDYLALSFCSRAKEVYDLKYLIKEYQDEIEAKKKSKYPKKEINSLKIIVKIEKQQAVNNFKEILEATDGIMIARGDLGIEMPPQEVPLIQKRLIDDCLNKAKPVIVATQMLDSMISKPKPTRAEVSDVANAVIDHADAVMLSGETASGTYPLEAVEMMSEIIKETEESIYDDLVIKERIRDYQPISEAMSNMAGILAGSIKAKLILVASLTGYAGRLVSRYRPELPIFVSTDNKKVQKQLNLSWGAIPFLLPTCRSVEELLDRSLNYLRQKKMIKKGDKIIVVAGEPVGRSGLLNLVEIKEV